MKIASPKTQPRRVKLLQEDRSVDPGRDAPFHLLRELDMNNTVIIGLLAFVALLAGGQRPPAKAPPDR